jgi:antitoxin HicB
MTLKTTAKQIDYAIMVEPLKAEDGGGWLASVPALPGCMGDGEWKDAARQLGRDIPGPAALGQWRQRVPRSLHDKLKRLAETEGVSLNQLVTSVLAESVGKRAV